MQCILSINLSVSVRDIGYYSQFYSNTNPPGRAFANAAVWYTIVFKVSAFQFFGQKLADVTPWSKILSSILITIIVELRPVIFVLPSLYV